MHWGSGRGRGRPVAACAQTHTHRQTDRRRMRCCRVTVLMCPYEHACALAALCTLVCSRVQQSSRRVCTSPKRPASRHRQTQTPSHSSPRTHPPLPTTFSLSPCRTHPRLRSSVRSSRSDESSRNSNACERRDCSNRSHRQTDRRSDSDRYKQRNAAHCESARQWTPLR